MCASTLIGQRNKTSKQRRGRSAAAEQGFPAWLWLWYHVLSKPLEITPTSPRALSKSKQYNKEKWPFKFVCAFKNVQVHWCLLAHMTYVHVCTCQRIASAVILQMLPILFLRDRISHGPGICQYSRLAGQRVLRDSPVSTSPVLCQHTQPFLFQRWVLGINSGYN